MSKETDEPLEVTADFLYKIYEAGYEHGLEVNSTQLRVSENAGSYIPRRNETVLRIYEELARFPNGE